MKSPARHRKAEVRAFTLLELITVMAVLSVLLALVAPALSSSFRARDLAAAGAQLLALTEYARDEAISQGVPMDVWVNPVNGQYGVMPKPGYPGDAARNKQYSLSAELHFDAANAAAPSSQSHSAAEFAPDGSLDPSSASILRIVNLKKAAIAVTETRDGYGYELGKEMP